jgi:hypothetical protein
LFPYRRGKPSGVAESAYLILKHGKVYVAPGAGRTTFLSPERLGQSQIVLLLVEKILG